MILIKKFSLISEDFSQSSPIRILLTTLTAIGTLNILAWILKYSNYGIDFTDESYYLVWIANPFLYDTSITQFGFIYYPLYSLMDGDIAAIRRANILVTFTLAWGLVYFFLKSLASGLKDSRIMLFVVSSALATSVFILFESWLFTPSYNSLNLQALLITANGLILAKKNPDRVSILGWVLIGIGGWLAFMAKPSTALALGICVCIYLMLARKFSIRMLTLTVTCAVSLLLVSALMIDGSALGFIDRIQRGIDFASHMGGGHTLNQILRIDEFNLSEKLKIEIFLLTSIISLALWCMGEKNKYWSFIGLIISIALYTFTALITLSKIDFTEGFLLFHGLLIFGVIYALVITALIPSRWQALRMISMQQWAITVLFLAMPHVFAFGTNGNYWQVGSSAGIFWLLASMTLLDPVNIGRGYLFLALPVALATQAVTAVLLQTGFEQPYRQTQPLRLNTSVIKIGPLRSELVLTESYAEYFASVESTVQKAGFKRNTPMIDMSGQSPGILYSIGAEIIGQAWTIGGYPGSLKLAQEALARTPCDKIAMSWILFEENGPRSIPTELMFSLGSDFPNSYKHVGTWLTAEGAGGFSKPRTQKLYKPVDLHKTLITCQELRKKIK